MMKSVFPTLLAATALLLPLHAWSAEDMGAACNVTTGGAGLQAMYPSTSFETQSTIISSYTSELLTLSFRRMPGTRDVQVEIEGHDNIIETQSDSLLSVHNGLHGSAVGFLTGDSSARDGIRHLEFNVHASNSAGLIRVVCDAQVVHEGDDRREAGIAGAAGQPRLGVSLVSFGTPN